MGLVYSTDQGQHCPKCQQPKNNCQCGKPKPPSGDGIVRIRRETKGRKGKGVTIISGVPLAGDELKALAKQLKQHCGSGGAIKDGEIEIQGDHRDKVLAALQGKGWTVKKAGG
ncbi:MAG: translation initiation factor Sui1 [Wenzhouxiangellaceae bacterium]